MLCIYLSDVTVVRINLFYRYIQSQLEMNKIEQKIISNRKLSQSDNKIFDQWFDLT